jgi:hypothetical protein
VEKLATVEVRGERGAVSLLWLFPLRGLVNAPPHPKAFVVKAKAKASARVVLELPLRDLAGVLGAETFGFELVVPVAMQRTVAQCLSVRPETPAPPEAPPPPPPIEQPGPRALTSPLLRRPGRSTQCSRRFRTRWNQCATRLPSSR